MYKNTFPLLQKSHDDTLIAGLLAGSLISALYLAIVDLMHPPTVTLSLRKLLGKVQRPSDLKENKLITGG